MFYLSYFEICGYLLNYFFNEDYQKHNRTQQICWPAICSWKLSCCHGNHELLCRLWWKSDISLKSNTEKIQFHEKALAFFGEYVPLAASPALFHPQLCRGHRGSLFVHAVSCHISSLALMMRHYPSSEGSLHLNSGVHTVILNLRPVFLSHFL